MEAPDFTDLYPSGEIYGMQELVIYLSKMSQMVLEDKKKSDTYKSGYVTAVLDAMRAVREAHNKLNMKQKNNL